MFHNVLSGWVLAWLPMQLPLHGPPQFKSWIPAIHGTQGEVVADFSPVQPWLLQAFGKRTNGWKISVHPVFFFFSSVFLLLKLSFLRNRWYLGKQCCMHCTFKNRWYLGEQCLHALFVIFKNYFRVNKLKCLGRLSFWSPKNNFIKCLWAQGRSSACTSLNVRLHLFERQAER